MLQEKCDGESLVIASALALGILYKDSEIQVRSHPANQAGSSSKEVSDIDLALNDKIFGCYEIKDKSFALSDVRHAVQKVQNEGLNNLTFVYTSDTMQEDVNKIYNEATNEFTGFDLYLVEASDFLSGCSLLAVGLSSGVLEEEANAIIKSIRPKTTTLGHLKTCWRF